MASQRLGSLVALLLCTPAFAASLRVTSLDGSTFVEVDATSGLFSVTVALDARGAKRALVRASLGSAY